MLVLPPTTYTLLPMAAPPASSRAAGAGVPVDHTPMVPAGGGDGGGELGGGGVEGGGVGTSAVVPCQVFAVGPVAVRPPLTTIAPSMTSATGLRTASGRSVRVAQVFSTGSYWNSVLDACAPATEPPRVMIFPLTTNVDALMWPRATGRSALRLQVPRATSKASTWVCAVVASASPFWPPIR